jgi:very-short-patch-repair endonuclease
LLEELEKGGARLEHLAGLLREGGLMPTAMLVGDQGTLVDVIEAFQAVDRNIRAQDWPSCLSWASDPGTAAPELREALNYGASLDPEVVATLAASEQPLQLREKLTGLGEKLIRSLGGWNEVCSAFEAAIETDLSALFPAVSSSIDDLGTALDQLSADEAGLRLAADFQRYMAEARAQGCDFVVSLARSHGVSHWRLADLYELLVCRAVLGAYLKADGEELTRLGGLTLEAVRTRFREIDKELQSLEAQRIVSERLADRPPWGNDTGPKGSWTEAALINNEVSKKKRHIPIRDLTKRAGRALQALKPVWMMSPSSVAQYVQPDTVTFDLVVIDEASQMRPEYATSAILRGKQLVVVGDSKQLPPTDFFQTNLAGLSDGDHADDEESITVDTESILDLANSRIGKRRQLSWHYRSRHESLIQFSNRQFYECRLVVFPSPSTDDPLLGVKHVYVKGTYEASINQAEAEAIIRDAIGLMIAHPECSMGIATMNIKQTELIKAEFDRLSGEHEAVRNYISAYAGGIDSFFIKNLENVQGDERDIILISTVYGPDKAGRVMQRFGPIASDVGHRRLNVLVTRAKLSTRIYTSLRSGDIKVVDGSKPGTIATRDYLTYAEGGARFDLAEGGEPDSDFEVFVADRLRAAGFEITHQVGVEKFRIDLGVRHPDYPLGFIAGIECDGARYHSGFTVRDRDKIRQSVLEGLGWKIYRVWSTDWFTDPDREAAKLIAQVTRWRDEFIASFQARQASGEFAAAVANDEEPRAQVPMPTMAERTAQEAASTPGVASLAPAKVEQGPRQVPTGRRRELDGIDWYEVETATRYEIWPDGVFGGEVEVLARATGAPQIYGGGMRIPKSEYRGSVEATGASFIEHDIYGAVRRVAQLARAALKE